MSLNEKQRLFVAGIIAGKTHTQAAIDAGYSKRSAHSQAYDLLKNPEIKALLDKNEERVFRAAQASRHFVVAGLMDEAEGVKKDTTAASRTRALELLGKALPGGSIFEERVKNESTVVGYTVVAPTEIEDAEKWAAQSRPE